MLDWEYLRISGLIILLEALGTALVWGLGHAIYLNRVHSRGWASTKRLLRKSGLVFVLALLVATWMKEGRALTTLIGAALGRPHSEYLAGALAQSGQGMLKQDHAKAFEWFHRAAEQGDPEAEYAVACAYHFGQGTPCDPEKALQWARASADSGNAMGMVLAGEMLQEADPSAAQFLFARSRPLLEARAAGGDGSACFLLGTLYQQGGGIPADPVMALAWMLRGRNLGLPPFQDLIAQRLEQSLTPAQRAQAAERAKTLVPSQAKSGDRMNRIEKKD